MFEQREISERRGRLLNQEDASLKNIMYTNTRRVNDYETRNQNTNIQIIQIFLKTYFRHYNIMLSKLEWLEN